MMAWDRRTLAGLGPSSSCIAHGSYISVRFTLQMWAWYDNESREWLRRWGKATVE